jgi:hypothetical protein
MGFEGVACNHLNQGKIQHWALVDMVTQLWSGNFSTSRVIIASQGLCSKQLVQKKVSVQYNFQIVLPYSSVVVNTFT